MCFLLTLIGLVVYNLALSLSGVGLVTSAPRSFSLPLFSLPRLFSLFHPIVFLAMIR